MAVVTNPSLDRLFAVLDPKSLILSQFGETPDPILQLTTDDRYVLERGPRYYAYANLRESRIRSRSHGILQQQPETKKPSSSVILTPTPPLKKQGRRTGSALAQSVPDFSSVLRKENRKPAAMGALPPVAEKSPAKGTRAAAVGSGGSREKSNGKGSMIARKSYANMDELKGFSTKAINGGGGGGRGWGYKQF